MPALPVDAIDLDDVQQSNNEKMNDNPEQATVQHEFVNDGINIDFSWMLTKTGEGSIDEYLEHPLNLYESRPMAQIIRGFTGLLGDLGLALIDIVAGIFGLYNERKVAHAQS